MSGALSMLMASGAVTAIGGGSFSVTVGTGSNTDAGSTQVNWVYGYSVVGYTSGSVGFNTLYVDYTQCPIGSVVAPSLAVTVIGIYSNGSSAGNASSYIVLTDGDTTVSAPNFATTLTIDGTLVSGTRGTPTYISVPSKGTFIGTGTLRGSTRYSFTLGAPAATLFGTTAGAVKTVVIT